MHKIQRILSGLCLGLIALAAIAQDITQPFNIPAQPLSSALDSLAKQGGLHVFYADSIVQGKRSAAVQGAYSPKQALTRLLAGSGINPTFTADNTAAADKNSRRRYRRKKPGES